MTDIPEQVIDARLIVDVGGRRYVELIERMAVPVASDTDVAELTAIGRLVRAAAGRYGGTLTELIAPLREAVLAVPDGDDLAAFEMWRHAALCLLQHVTTGRPIDFQGRPVPDAVSGALAAWRQHWPIGVDPPVGDAATEVLPVLRVFRNWQQVPVNVRALTHVTSEPVGHWYVRGDLDQWRRTGPDGDETLHELRQMFVLGNMIAVDPQTGQPC